MTLKIVKISGHWWSDRGVRTVVIVDVVMVVRNLGAGSWLHWSNVVVAGHVVPVVVVEVVLGHEILWWWLVVLMLSRWWCSWSGEHSIHVSSVSELVMLVVRHRIVVIIREASELMMRRRRRRSIRCSRRPEELVLWLLVLIIVTGRWPFSRSRRGHS